MDIDILQKYSPYIFFDEHEPFFPVKVGCTILNKPGNSPSFSREIHFSNAIQFVLEYAIYWDYDIQHLYDLEHVWVYVDNKGNVADCEASFHGGYIKALMRGHINIENCTHVKLYSQPGKHAFSPIVEGLDMIPNLHSAPYEKAGSMGLIVTDIFKGVYFSDNETDQMVKRYLQQYKFKPSMRFNRYTIPKCLFITWNELCLEIPHRIEECLTDIKRTITTENNEKNS